MQVLFVSGRDLRAASSFEMYNIAKEISKYNIRCYVLFPNFDDHALGSIKKYEAKNLKLIIVSNPIKILHTIRKIKPLVVHAWYSNIYQFFVALVAKIFVHSKVILHVTDFEEFFIFSNVKSLKGLIKAVLKIFVIKSFPIISDGITMISPNLKVYISKTKTKKKPTYVLLPYTPKNCFKISSRYMKKIKKKKKDFWFLFFGSISKFQGIEEIIKSFLKANIGKTKLIIIGDGPLKNELMNRYEHSKNLVLLET
jgi:hypothetical protein